MRAGNTPKRNDNQQKPSRRTGPVHRDGFFRDQTLDIRNQMRYGRVLRKAAVAQEMKVYNRRGGALLRCQTLEVRNQMRYRWVLRKAAAAKEIKVYNRRGGSPCPPARKLDFVIGHVEYQNYSFHNRRKLFYSRTLLGRAQRPAPTSLSRLFMLFEVEKLYERSVFMKSSCAASDF